MSRRGRRKKLTGRKKAGDSGPSEFAVKEEAKKAEKEEPVEKKPKKKVSGKRKSKGPGMPEILSDRRAPFGAAAVVIVILVAWWASGISVPAAPQNETCTTTLVKQGDSVSVQYTGKLPTGEVFDSGSIDFVVGAGQMIQGFDEAVDGGCVGRETTVTIPPEKAYGEPDPNMVISMPLVFETNRSFEITKEQFEGSFGSAAELGKSYEAEGLLFPMKVTDISGDNTTIEWDVVVGDTAPAGVEPWEIRARSVSKSTVELERQATTGMKVGTVLGQRDVTVRDGNIIIDMNHELAGKTLIFTIKVLNATKLDPLQQACSQLNVPKSDRPEVDLNIFSYCPAGTAAQSNFLPAARLLGDKADFRVRFFSHMHGEHERLENMRQECIQEIAPDKYWNYSEKWIQNVFGSCRSADCLKEEDDKIMAELGIGIAEVEKCLNESGESLYNLDIAKATSLQLRYSPSFVINGVYIANMDRTPDGIKSAVCCAFNDPPAECGQAITATGAVMGSGGCG